MPDDAQVTFLVEGLDVNLACFEDPGQGGVPDIGREEAAYFTLENAALLRRLAPDHPRVAGLLGRPAGFRGALVCSACLFVAGFHLTARLERLMDAHKECDDDALDEMEALLLRRDALEAALRLAADLADDLFGEEEVWPALLKAQEIAWDADAVLYRRPDILCVAARILEPAPNSPPWLEWVRQLDRRMETESLGVLLAVPRHPQAEAGVPIPPVPWTWHQKVGARLQAEMAETSLGIAASGQAERPIRAGDLSLATADFGIEEDRDVRVEFDVRAEANASPALKVWLTGPPEAVRRYTRVVVTLPGVLAPLQASFCRTTATLPLAPPALDAFCSPAAAPMRVIVVDRSGSSHSVQLEAKHP